MASFKDVTSIDWSSKLGGFGQVVEGLDDIRQCIFIILQTQKGSVPHRLDFGCDLWRYIDLPVPAAKPQIIREVTQALSRWEPRAALQSVELEPSSEKAAHYILTVTWSPVDSYDADTIIKQEVLV